MRLPQWALAQLLYGYRSVAALRVAGLVDGPRRALENLARFFPVTPHFFHPMDKF